MDIHKSLAKYFLAVAVVVGSWGCSSTNNLQHANYEDDDVYFSRKDREKAKLAKEAEVKNNPTVVTGSTGMDVNPTYGVTTNTNPTNVNPEYVGNTYTGNSTITNNSNNYSGNEYYTEYRANRMQVPRATYDNWGNVNQGVFYDPYLNPSSPFYDPYLVQASMVPLSVRLGWGRSGWYNRRWNRRYGWYGNPYQANDFWYRRNSWYYGGGFGFNTNPWCPPNYARRPIYTNTTRIPSRPARVQVVNRGPRRSNAGRRGNVILTNTTTTKRRAQNKLNTSGGRDINKRAQTAGRRYKRSTTAGNGGKRVTGTTTNTRRRTTRRSTTRSNTRTRRGSSYNYNRNRSRRTSSFNRSYNTNRSRSTYSRPSSRTRTRSVSRPSSRTRTRSVSRPSNSSKRSSSKRRKKIN